MSFALQPIQVALPSPAPDEPDPFAIEIPSNRGKFSDVRDKWEQIHRARHLQWVLGDSIETIAADHGITYNAVKHSIQFCEGRLLSRAEVLAARSMRLRLRVIAGLGEKYITELEKLMSDDNPFVRSKALEHFRRTLGMDSGGVQVRTEVNVHTTGPNGSSFEERLQRIRAAQRESLPEGVTTQDRL